MLTDLLAFNNDSFYVWQLVTAHFVHYDSKHALLNISAFVLLLYVFPMPKQKIVKAVLLAMMLIDAYLLLASINSYRGFSGLIYVIPGLAAAECFNKRDYSALFLIVLVVFIYIFILSEDKNISYSITWYSLKQAHLIGFMAGLISPKFLYWDIGNN